MTAGLQVPEITSDMDTLTAALAYAAAGWYVLPVRRGTKKPGSIVGNGWQHQSSRHPAVAGLDPLDRAHREAWCSENDQHGITMKTVEDDDLLEFSWGGRRLAMVPRGLLIGDGPLPEPQFVGEVPDTPEGLLRSAASPLTPNQRSILFLLAIGAFAEQTGLDAETAAEQLDRYELSIIGDGTDAVLEVDGRRLARAPLAWLAGLDGAGPK
jgi:hypothetical protein